jgi:CDP-diacylglycerol---glycerol-3-phosphate 3-phosphatidyltransferase
MSASHPSAHGMPGGDSLLPAWVKQSGRAILDPIVHLALALHVTANTVTVLGLAITVLAAVLIGSGGLLAGALVLMGGSLLDAVDGALARATGGGTPFGGFLDSTIDRASEAIVYLAIAAYYLQAASPTWPVMAAFIALAGSFMVSYSRARAEGIGISAAVGIAPRTERLVLIIAGVGLAGLGIGPALIAVLWIIAALTVATTAQRIWHVWRLTASPRG